MSRNCVVGWFVSIACVLTAAGAWGASITSGNVPQSDENVLLGRTGLLTSGTTVQGWTNQSQYVVDFVSTSSIKADSRGQAQLQASAKNATFNDLAVSMHDPAMSFQSLIFNLDAAKNGSAGVTVFGPGNAVLLQQSVNLRGSGNNFFTIVAGATEYISRVQVLSSVGISDFKQFRIGGAGLTPVLAPQPPVVAPVETGTPPVPAPASALGGAALLGLLAAARVGRKRRQQTPLT